MNIKIGISQGGKALIESKNGVMTGGFFHELKKLFVEFDIESVEGGIIKLSDNKKGIISENNTICLVGSDKGKETSSFTISKLQEPLTIYNVVASITKNHEIKSILDIFYQEGAVISIDGYEFYKIAPASLDHNIKLLNSGVIKFGWMDIYEQAVKFRKPNYDPGLKIVIKGKLVTHINFFDIRSFYENLEEGTLCINWVDLLEQADKPPALLNFKG